MKISVQLALWSSRVSLTLMDYIGDYILQYCNCAWYKDELQTFIIKDNKIVNTFQGCKECVYNENGSKPSHKWHLCITALSEWSEQMYPAASYPCWSTFCCSHHPQVGLLKKKKLFSMQFVDFTSAKPVHRARGDICLIMWIHIYRLVQFCCTTKEWNSSYTIIVAERKHI